MGFTQILVEAIRVIYFDSPKAYTPTNTQTPEKDRNMKILNLTLLSVAAFSAGCATDVPIPAGYPTS